MEWLMGFNAVEAALTAGRRGVQRVYLEKGHDSVRANKLVALARRHAVAVEEVSRQRLCELASGVPRSTHQGVLAGVAPLPRISSDQILDRCGKTAIILVLDQVEDPRNLGAILRSAAAAGVAGVFIPERRAAGMSPTVAKAAAGSLELVPLARIGNLAAFLRQLKEKGFWTVGLAAGSPTAWDQVSYPARLALIVGGEADGLRRLTAESCDQLVCIPMAGGLESLNVSVATGICLFEAVRQRRAAGSGGPGPGGRAPV